MKLMTLRFVPRCRRRASNRYDVTTRKGERERDGERGVGGRRRSSVVVRVRGKSAKMQSKTRSVKNKRRKQNKSANHNKSNKTTTITTTATATITAATTTITTATTTSTTAVDVVASFGTVHKRAHLMRPSQCRRP